MSQKAAFVFSGILTAFLLVMGGAVIGRVSQSTSSSAPIAATTAPDPIGQVVAQMQDRDAAYRQLIDQANARLQQAYSQQQAAAAQINRARSAAAASSAQSSQAAAAPAQPAGPALSSDSATNIAIDASGGKWVVRAAELVLFESKVAYEIGFTNGAIYVDANSGAVLYNGVTARHAGGTVASNPAAQPSSGTPSDDHGDDGGHDN